MPSSRLSSSGTLATPAEFGPKPTAAALLLLTFVVAPPPPPPLPCPIPSLGRICGLTTTDLEWRWCAEWDEGEGRGCTMLPPTTSASKPPPPRVSMLPGEAVARPLCGVE